jgi:hypothetical protein
VGEGWEGGKRLAKLVDISFIKNANSQIVAYY